MSSLEGYLEALASAQPVPGGGSAAMVVGAQACALVSMVARICRKSAKYAALHEHADSLISVADDLRVRMLELKTEDERAFEAVVAARGNDEAMQRALRSAARTPLTGANAALEALSLAEAALAFENANLVSDVGCAAEFAHAAISACIYNVRINHKFIKDQALIREQREEIDTLQRDALSLHDTIKRVVSQSLGP